MTKKRCPWCEGDALYEQYHDEVWGVPCRDDTLLFEFLTLEGAQAGLSWISILRRRASYKAAFDDYDLDRIMAYKEEKILELLQNKGIIRNRLKIKSVIKNARAFKAIQVAYGSFSNYLWQFVDDQPILNNFKCLGDVPTESEVSKKIAKDLKKRGFSFVGPVIIYAYMQAVGLTNDHLVGCYKNFDK